MENDLSERLINFSIDVLKYMKKQPDNLELRNIKNQGSSGWMYQKGI